MLEKLVIVDYHEGAGGEFLASVISAHWGHPLVLDSQVNPNYLQKWFNSHSIIRPDWKQNFEQYLKDFLDLCAEQNVRFLAVPYHLYKSSNHVTIIQQLVPTSRFVKICSKGWEKEIQADFERKVSEKTLTIENLPEIKFLLDTMSIEQKKNILQLVKQGKLTYGNFFKSKPLQAYEKDLPSNDIVIDYKDFFYDIDRIPETYEKLCIQLELQHDKIILDQVIERNKSNLQQQQKWMESK